LLAPVAGEEYLDGTKYKIKSIARVFFIVENSLLLNHCLNFYYFSQRCHCWQNFSVDGGLSAVLHIFENSIQAA